MDEIPKHNLRFYFTQLTLKTNSNFVPQRGSGASILCFFLPNMDIPFLFKPCSTASPASLLALQKPLPLSCPTIEAADRTPLSLRTHTRLCLSLEDYPQLYNRYHTSSSHKTRQREEGSYARQGEAVRASSISSSALNTVKGK